MTSLIAVHADFESHWPFVADHFFARWEEQDETTLIRLPRGDQRTLSQACEQPEKYTRVASLGVPVTAACLTALTTLREATFPTSYRGIQLDADTTALVEARGIKLYNHLSEGFWGQSVSEFALALTLCGLRRIPQNYHEIITSHEPWERYQPTRNQGPGTLGAQFSDDVRFTHGTIAGKRVRIVGAGNIGSRYASFVKMLGADVAVWDPFATEAHFHRAGSRKVWHLDELMRDAEIFVPMLPLTDSTRGLVTAAHIDSLPQGCLTVLATRARICDVDAIRRRVLADELSLAADVFDIEPLPLDDPLLGRHNVVHTPHLAGRTRDANQQWAEDLLAQFEPPN